MVEELWTRLTHNGIAARILGCNSFNVGLMQRQSYFCEIFFRKKCVLLVLGSLGAVLTLRKANLAILSKELLPGARPCTPCHFMVQFAVRPHPSHQTNPLSWWNPAVLFADGSSTCQLLVLTDAFVRQLAGSIEQSAPRRPRHAAAEAAETQVKSVWKF